MENKGGKYSLLLLFRERVREPVTGVQPMNPTLLES